MSADLVTLRPLRLPNFALFWSAQGISKFGDPITLVALATVSFAVTGSALFTAVAVVITMLPSAIFGFAAGAIADAIGHRRAMIACDVLRVALIGLIPPALGLGAPLWVAYLLAFGSAICGTVFSLARVAIVPTLVPPEQLSAGNSLVYATDRSVEIGGLLAGGVLVALMGTGAFYVDAATFALSAILLARMGPVDAPSGRLAWSSVWRDAAVGVQTIRNSAVLRSNLVFSLVAQLSVPIYNGLLPVLIFRRFAPGDVDLGAAMFGTAEAVLAAGAVGAAVFLPAYVARFKKGLVLIVAFAAYGAAVIAVGFAPTFGMLLVLVGIIGVLNVMFFVPNVTISQEATPASLRGRVFGARSALLSLSWLPVVLVGGTLADIADVGTIIAAAGLTTLVSALIASRFASIRDVA